MQSLGMETSLISAVGNDQLGNGILDFLRKNGVNTSYIQQLKDRPTSEVEVFLDQGGSASYTIKENVAWDFIEFNEDLKQHAETSDCVLFGSLSCRNETSHATLQQLLKHAKYKVFDVNLRPPHYTHDGIWNLMNAADLIKMNDEEILEVINYKLLKNSDLKNSIQYISQQTKTNTICITCGAEGAILYHENAFYEHPGFKVKTQDTVGAGDSFLAALVSQLLQAVNPKDALAFACAMGALVASEEGANPIIPKEKVEALLRFGGAST